MKNQFISRKVLFLLCVCLVVSIGAVSAEVSNYIKSDIPAEVMDENFPDALELQYKIYIENVEGGTISKVDPDGEHHQLGSVVIPATETYQPADGFWAAQYSKAVDGNHGNVSATGVNAMHLRVGPEEQYDPEQAQQGRDAVWKPHLISLLPDREYHKAGPGPHPGRIATDISGGEGLFGTYSAYVGSPVKYNNSDEEWRPVEEFYRDNGFDQAPEQLLIEVYQPVTSNGSPEYLLFENEVGGQVYVQYANGFEKPIASVLQRVEGVGRFGGSEYADVGRVRANHGGVLCLSTSPYTGFTWDIEQRGGFQIIPANHAVYSRHFLGANYIDRPQWLIVGSLGSTPERLYDPVYYDEGLAYDPHWEAVAPIFGMYVKPKQITTHDMISNGRAKQSAPSKPIKGLSTYYEISTDQGQTWEDPEVLQGTIDDALIDVTHIRVKLNY